MTTKPKTLKTISPSAFNKLGIMRRRVMIAQDVLAQLKANKIEEERGTVITTCKIDPKWGDEDLDCIGDGASVQLSIQKADKCHVCAKGAVIHSLASKFNHIKGRSIDTMYRGTYNAREELDTKKIFGKDLWQELEAQFEGDSSFRTPAVEALVGDNAEDIDEQDLESLMKNLIRNKGKLKVGKHLIG